MTYRYVHVLGHSTAYPNIQNQTLCLYREIAGIATAVDCSSRKRWLLIALVRSVMEI